MNQVLADSGGAFYRKQLIQLVIFIVIFGLLIAVASSLLNKFIGPQILPFTDLIQAHPFRALGIYFIFVMIASVVIPIPTLPVDLLLFGLIDPASVISTRVLGGIAGGSVSYYLSYNYGRPLLKRWLSKGNFELVERMSKKLSWKQFFIITMVPIVNAELMAFVGGVGKMGYRKTTGTLLLAIAYRVLFTYIVVHYY